MTEQTPTPSSAEQCWRCDADLTLDVRYAAALRAAADAHLAHAETLGCDMSESGFDIEYLCNPDDLDGPVVGIVNAAWAAITGEPVPHTARPEPEPVGAPDA